MLRAAGITRDFPGVRALDGVDFDVVPGEVHALVGENGAGKSTLVKILAGALEPTAGHAELDGERLPEGDPLGVRARGLGVIYQESTLVPELSVAENVFLGRETSRAGWLARGEMAARTRELTDRLGLDVRPETRAAELGIGAQQLVEIARALALDAKVLIFDEPTTALTGEETERLFVVVRELVARGLGIVWISHRLDEVFELTQRVTVLRDGASIATARTADTDRRELIRWMVGREVEEEFPPRDAAFDGSAPVALEVKRLASPKLADVSLSLRRGEILGVAGLVGAGKSTLGRSITGALSRAELRQVKGEVRLGGRAVRFEHPADALRAGMAYLSEDRKRSGIFAELGVDENVALPHLARFTRAGLIDTGARNDAAHSSAERFRVRAASLDRPIRTLSGGNQQKALLARLLLAPLEVLVLDEPTRGVDVGARAEIYKILRELTAEGLAVLMLSSELEELLGMCDRIAVLCEGRLTGELSGDEATPRAIMDLATRTTRPETAR